MALRFRVAAHLVEHGALGGQNVPVGLVRRVGAVEHVQRLLIISGFGERAPVSAEHGSVARAFDRSLFEHGDSLGTLSRLAQRFRVAQ